jgi:hypothetical protein
MNRDERFSLSEAEEITGVPRSSLVGWLNRQLLLPARPGHGHGSRRLFSVRDLVWIGITHGLTTMGVRAEQAARFADEVVEPVFARDMRWCVFILSEHGCEYGTVQNARDLGLMLEPFGRPGPRAAIVLDGRQVAGGIVERAEQVLAGIQGTSK